MGGVTDSQVNFEQDGEMFYAKLTGNISTANNDGYSFTFRSFIQKLWQNGKIFKVSDLT